MKLFFILFLGVVLPLQGLASWRDTKFRNTISVEAGDSHEAIIEKAAHVVPSSNQLDALRNEFIAFIHFGPNTFTRMEWGNGRENPKVFDLKELDTAHGPAALLDDDAETYVAVDKEGEGIVISADAPVTLNRIVLQEAVATNGERVERHAVDAWVDGEWKEIASSGNIGYKRILRFPDVTTDRIRVRVLESRLTPAISTVSAHYYKGRPPRLCAVRDLEGMVAIEPVRQDFNWNSHGGNIAENLNAGFRIYYTTDGTEPTEASAEYTAPFMLGNSELCAAAVLNGKKGDLLKERFGYVKKGWKVSGRTVCSVVLDLGNRQKLSGFAFTPRKQEGIGTVGGTICFSSDGKNWRNAESFEFGNLINDPTRRHHHFGKPADARYIRFESPELAFRPDDILVADIDIF